MYLSNLVSVSLFLCVWKMKLIISDFRLLGYRQKLKIQQKLIFEFFGNWIYICDVVLYIVCVNSDKVNVKM